MKNDSELLIINSGILPDVFSGVMSVKKIIAKNPDKSLSEACKSAGISRSTFYKYKDFVFSFNEKEIATTVTLALVLSDVEGVLSRALSAISKAHGNILTINQSVPVNGAASLTVTLRTENLTVSIKKLLEKLETIEGVNSVKIL